MCVDAAAILAGKASFSSLSHRLAQARAGGATRNMELWAGGLSRGEKLDGSLYHDAKAETQGLQVGIDWAKPIGGGGFSFGVYFDCSKSGLRLADRAVSTDTESTAGGLYAAWTLGKWHLDTMVRRANGHYDISPRNTAPFSMKGDSWGGSIETGLALPLGRAWRLEPQVQLTCQTHRIDKTKNADGRTFEVDRATSLEGRAGVRLWRDLSWRAGMSKLTPWLRTSWLREFKGRTIVRVTDEDPFLNDLGGSTAMIDLGLALELGRGFTVNARGACFLGGKTTGHGFDAALGRAW
jgi:outer membrane autotransporter protein